MSDAKDVHITRDADSAMLRVYTGGGGANTRWVTRSNYGSEEDYELAIRRTAAWMLADRIKELAEDVRSAIIEGGGPVGDLRRSVIRLDSVILSIEGDGQ